MYVYECECVCVLCICVYSILTLNCLSVFWERNSSTKLVECFGLSLVGILLTDTKKLLFLCITGEANCRVLNGTHAISKISAYKSLYIQHTVTHTQINTIIIYIKCLIFIIILYTWSLYTLCERVCCCGLCLVTRQMQWSTIYYHKHHQSYLASLVETAQRCRDQSRAAHLEYTLPLSERAKGRKRGKSNRKRSQSIQTHRP